MKLIAGLGNPGAKYSGHRHNVGFMAADRIARDYQLGNWRQKFQGQTVEGRIDGKRVLLLKPETFMNDSGRSVGDAMRFHRLEPSDVIVIHDELDLDPGRIRSKSGGGTAGHRGLNSVKQHIGEGFSRVRIGIGHPGRRDLVRHYVLRDFHKSDSEWLDDLLAAVSRAAGQLAAGELGKFQNEVARHRQLDGPEETAEQPIATDRPDGILARLLQKFSAG
ncbi:MAG: aminoacyl-tRNA hydrolase [Rhodobacteraceae bacterium]|nr:aminoacyl-tRNA hydrolase [Paracoccaceae bacterium]